MKKSLLSTAILGGAFLLLLAWFIFYENSYRDTTNDSDQKKLVSLKTDDIQSVTLSSSKGEDPKAQKTETLELKKTNKEWHLLKPVEDLADTSSVESLLNSLTSATEERVVEEKAADLAPYGLKSPAVVLTVRAKAGDKGQTIYLGNDTPVGYGVYAKIGDSQKVIRVARSLRNSLSKDSGDLRNKKVFPSLARHTVAEIEITSPRGNVVLNRKQKDQWILARKNLPADQNTVNKTLNALLEAKAKSFISGPPEKFGLNRPKIKATLTANDKKRYILRLSQQGKTYYAKREDSPNIYQVEQAFVDKLELSSEEYQETSLAKFNRFNISKVTLNSQSPLEFVKADGNWTLPADSSFKLDSNKVDNLLATLQDVKIQKFDSKSAPIATPALAVTLFEKSGDKEKETLSLKFSNPTAKRVHVIRSDFPTSFQIALDDFNKINMKKDAFRQEEKKAKKEDKAKKS